MADGGRRLEQEMARSSREAGAGAAACDGGGEAGEGYSLVGQYLDVSRRRQGYRNIMVIAWYTSH